MGHKKIRFYVHLNPQSFLLDERTEFPYSFAKEKQHLVQIREEILMKRPEKVGFMGGVLLVLILVLIPVAAVLQDISCLKFSSDSTDNSIYFPGSTIVISSI